MFWFALLGFAIQFVVIYAAIRLALVHDRQAPAKAVASAAAVEARKTTNPGA